MQTLSLVYRLQDDVCKINVSPASGRDVERSIGLVGSRGSIEAAKRAILEKVDAVVSCTTQFKCERVANTTVGGQEPIVWGRLSGSSV